MSAISLLIHFLFKSDGEHQEHRFRFWPVAGAEQPGYRNAMPPPLTPEQFFQLQMQMMATLNNTVQALQQVHAQLPPPPPPQQPRDRRVEFLRGHPLTFSHMSDPLQADDWLRAVERQLDIA